MKVIVTKWVVSGRVDCVDLEPTNDGKYLTGEANGFTWFIPKHQASTTIEDAKKQTVAAFVARRNNLVKQLEGLSKTELEVLRAIDEMDSRIAIP